MFNRQRQRLRQQQRQRQQLWQQQHQGPACRISLSEIREICSDPTLILSCKTQPTYVASSPCQLLLLLLLCCLPFSARCFPPAPPSSLAPSLTPSLPTSLPPSPLACLSHHFKAFCRNNGNALVTVLLYSSSILNMFKHISVFP